MVHFESGIKEILENQKSPFYLLTPEEKEELQDHISLTSYRRNEYIFREGDKPSGFMMLVTGKVKIFKEGVGGRSKSSGCQNRWGSSGIVLFLPMRTISPLP